MHPLLLAATVAATTASAVPPAPPAPQTRAQVDVARDRGPQEVIVQTRELPAGASSGWHTHPGVEISTVLSGATDVTIGTDAPRRVAAGETITIPSGVPHRADGDRDGPTRLILTFVVDKGAPLRAPCAAP